MQFKFASPLVVRSALVAALGGLLFGFDTAVISGTTDALTSVFSLSEFWLGFTVAVALFGTILGAATVQIPTNALGRKKTLLMIAVLYFVSAVGSAFPWDWESFLFFRFIGGVGVGGASVVSPLYTTEIAPAKSRGFLVAFTQFNIVFGILLAYLSNFFIAAFDLGDAEWRLMFGVEAAPAAAFFFLLFLNPESPRWLLAKNRTEEARSVLNRLLPNETENVDAEIQTIRAALDAERADGKETFFCRKYRKPILLAIAIAAFNQLSGVNAILYYAPKVFMLTGASREAAMFFPTIVGLANLVFTMAAMAVIDGLGRRKLMFVGSIGYIVGLLVVAGTFATYRDAFDASLARLAAEEEALAAQNVEPNAQTPPSVAPINEKNNDVAATNSASNSATKTVVDPNAKVPTAGVVCVLIGLIVFIAAHAFGQGACIWVFIGEIFPNAVRAQGQALGSFTHWILAALVSGLFPPILKALGPTNIFAVFAGLMVLQLLWVAFVMPETKRIPLEEMQRKLGVESANDAKSTAV